MNMLLKPQHPDSANEIPLNAVMSVSRPGCLAVAESNDPAYYIPAWGGFCSYGIAHEVVENVGILGPAADPGHWWIEDEVLYLFRSSALREEFIRDAEPNIDNGWAMWREWFGDKEKTLFNTACF
eukprot:jgi/Undpi1/6340/HiC_scaffold_20.g08823.m1